VLQGLVKFWSIPPTTGSFLLENPFAAGLAQRLDLDYGVLAVSL